MRALIISDLHIGGRLEHDVLRRSEPLAALLSALDDIDRLVLLGDIVELLEDAEDAAILDARKDEPTRPFSEFVAELEREHLRTWSKNCSSARPCPALIENL